MISEKRKEQKSLANIRYYNRYKDSIREYRRLWRWVNHKRLLKHRRTRRLPRIFGITIEKYNEILSQQKGVCAVCRKKNPNNNKRKLAVDHDHKTKKIRGFLCFKCNIALGLLKEDLTVLTRLVKYLTV